MSKAVENLLANLTQYQSNPAGIARSVITLLREASDGTLNVVDPTNPFIFSLQASAMLTASALTENQALHRRQYPQAAQTAEDLYPHMSDKDYVDLFALPSKARFVFMIERQELLNALVLDPLTGIRKVVIPRNTTVTVSGIKFSLQYPVEIRQMAHGGLQIVYDVSKTSPLLTLDTNVITTSYASLENNVSYVGFELEMHQFFINTSLPKVSETTGFSHKVALTDQFYYCRVYEDLGDNAPTRFVELATTHTDEIYDPQVPTAVIQVVEGEVRVKIPIVYLQTGMITRNLRVDVYETKGPLDLNLSNYTSDQFEARFFNVDPTEDDEYAAPVKNFRNLLKFSQSITQGGRNAMSFEELRARVIRNAIGVPSLPITNVQMESTLERQGYTVVKNVDNITNRVFLAARNMPESNSEELLTSANGGIGTLSITTAQAVSYTTVIDNGSLVTFTPDTIYRIKKGILEIVSDAEVSMLQSLPPDQRALLVTSGQYFYTPFHYVMDSNQNEFDLRAYYLDKPVVKSRSFIAENDTTLLQVSTIGRELTRTSTGYRLRIATKSSDGFKALNDDEVAVQLAFIPAGENTRAYMQGQLLGLNDDGERIFEFDLITDFSIDAKDQLAFLTFTMFDTSERLVRVPLDTQFDVIYSTSSVVGPQWVLSQSDAILGMHALPANSRAITHEKLRLHFGSPLRSLWSRARTVVSEQQYQRHTADIAATYERDVYERDAGGLAFSVVDGEIVYNILHHAGDPILDAQGDPVYRYRVGDIKRDEYNQPIVISSRQLLRQMDLFLLEGAYYFASDVVTQTYKQTLVDKVVSWLVDDLPNMGKGLLEQTNLYFYPTTNVGNVRVMVENGLILTIEAGQALTVRLHVSSSVFDDPQLRKALIKKTVQTLGAGLSQKKVAVSDLIDKLKDQYKEDVIGVNIKGLGGASNYDVITVVDDSTRLSLRKRLVSRSDEVLSLEEDVTIDFVKHQIDN